MLSPYRRVFRLPGAWQFSAAGTLARLPISMMTLGIVVLVSSISGSYGQAGAVSAAYIIGNAAFAIPHGRLADHFGQSRVLYVDTVVFATSTALLIVSIDGGWRAPWPHLLAVLAGMSIPQIGVLVRSRWAHLVQNEHDRHTAFSVEGVLDEFVFVTGPALVTWAATSFNPDSGLILAVVAGTVGTVLLAAQRATAPPVTRAEPGSRRDPLPWGALIPLALGGVALGSLFGSIEVNTVAFAEELGAKVWAGALLAIFAFGSLVAGVVTGAVSWQASPLQRARIGISLLALGSLSLPFLPNLAVAAVALLLCGLTLAPTLISLFSLIEAAAPRSRLNEAMGFVQTGVALGVAPGAWLGGILSDTVGAQSAYWVSTLSAVLAALAGFAIRVPETTSPRSATPAHH